MDEKQIIRQGGIPIGYQEGSSAVLDSDFLGCDTGRQLIRSGFRVHWQPGVAKQLGQEACVSKKFWRVRVYQLKASAEIGKKFIGYTRLCEQFGGISVGDYEAVFDGEMNTDCLDELYEQLNSSQLPKAYHGHRLSISDVVEICHENGSEFWYLDLEEFIPISRNWEN